MTTTVEPGSANGTKPAAPVAGDGRVGATGEDLARQLAEQARAEGLSLTGPGGLLGRLTKVPVAAKAQRPFRRFEPPG